MPKKEMKKRVTFKLENPSVQEVFLAGSFNAWSPTAKALKKDAKGIWKTTVMLSRGFYEYRFVVDGVWQDDPENPEKSMNEFGSYNSVLDI
jgi:1,4-alpha-glucan branching enzyme